MLVLTRAPGEKLIINGSIVITILKISSTKEIRIGIDAPLNISVDRFEVYERKKSKNLKG